MSSQRWDNLDRYVIISADTHGGADLRDYRPYLPARWHEEFDAWADDYRSPYDDLVHATAKRNWDSDLRIAEMDADGIAAEVVFPNTIPPFYPATALHLFLPKTADEFERRWVGVQAHNRWMVDFVGLEPVRRRGIVQLFPNDVDAAVAEVKWAHETGAFGAALLATVPPGASVPPIFHERYNPLWEICAELDFPIATHNVAIPDLPMDQPVASAITVLESGLWNQQTLIELLVSGVFDRYPTLKFVPTEAGLNWQMAVARGIEGTLPSMYKEAPNRTMKVFGDPAIESLSLTPTEFVRRNVYYGLSGPGATREAVESRYEVGVDHIMWGTDYPHEEGSTPQSELLLRWKFNDVPEEEVRMMLAGTAADLYGFDLDALVPIATRVGPTVERIHTAISADEFAQNPNPIPEFVSRPFAGGALLERSRAADSAF